MREGKREGILDARIGKFPSIKAMAAAPLARSLARSLEGGTDGRTHEIFIYTRRARALSHVLSGLFPLSLRLPRSAARRYIISVLHMRLMPPPPLMR